MNKTDTTVIKDFGSLPYYFYIRGNNEFDKSSISLSPNNKYTAEDAIKTVIKLNKEARKNNRSLFGIGITVPGTLDHGEDFNGIGVVEFRSLEEHIYEIDDLFFSTSSNIINNKNYIDAINDLAETAKRNKLAVKYPRELLLININKDLIKAAQRHAMGLEPEEEDAVDDEWEDITNTTVSIENNTFTKEQEPDYKLNEINKSQNSRDAFIEPMKKELEKYINDNNLDITITDIDYYDPTQYGLATGDKTLNVLVGYKSDSIKADDLYDDLITNVQLSSSFIIEWQPVSKKEHETLNDYLYFLTMMNDINNRGTESYPIAQFQDYTNLDDILNNNELKDAYKWNLKEKLNVYFSQYFPMVSVEETHIMVPNDEGYSGKYNELQVLLGYKSDALNEEIIRNNLQNDLQLFEKFNTNWTPIDLNKYKTIEDYLTFEKKELENFKKTFIEALKETATPIINLDYSPSNYSILFGEGVLNTPIEQIKMGEHQFEKFSKEDRNYLMGATYETLTNPSIIFDKIALDKKENKKKPCHIYGKSFYRINKNKERVVESVAIFRDDKNIVISSHNKELKAFVKQIKTADDIIYIDESISRVAILRNISGASHVRAASQKTQLLNPNYNKSKILSINKLLENGKLTNTTLQDENNREVLRKNEQIFTNENIYVFKYMPTSNSISNINNLNKEGYDKDGKYIEYDGTIIKAPDKITACKTFMNKNGTFGHPDIDNYNIYTKEEYEQLKKLQSQKNEEDLQKQQNTTKTNNKRKRDDNSFSR